MDAGSGMCVRVTGGLYPTVEKTDSMYPSLLGAAAAKLSRVMP